MIIKSDAIILGKFRIQKKYFGLIPRKNSFPFENVIFNLLDMN